MRDQRRYRARNGDRDRDAQGSRRLELLSQLLIETGIETVPMTIEQVRLAREVYSRFGKGRQPRGAEPW
jgi:uncharacterized protein with PIN domain